MNRTRKTVLFLLLAASISGCKLAVIVVEGGEVQSEYAGTCPESTVCLHQVDDPDYGESFTAVPQPGWAFVYWQSGDGFFCGGSAQPTCQLSFPGLVEESEEVANMIASDETFYLMPIFKRTSGYPPLPGSKKEWLQPADFVDYSPRQVAAVCPPPAGLCSGSLPDSSIDLTGYYWASLEEIAELLDSIRGYMGRPITGAGLIDPLPDPLPADPIPLLLTVDEEFLFEYFTPTYRFFEGGPQLVLSAFSRDQAVEPQQYEGIVIQYGFIGDGDAHIDVIDAGGGVWFWRPLD